MVLDILPLTIFEEFGKYLSKKDFIALLSLSKGIRDKVLSSNIKIRDIDLTINEDEVEKNEYKLYKKYQRHFTDIKVEIHGNTDDFVCKILDNIRNVHALIFSRCQNITHLSLKRFVNFNNLRNLVLTCFCTDKGIKAMVHSLNNLESLNLSSCEQITDYGLKYLATLTNLCYLNLFDCDKITDKGIDFIAQSLINLKVLNVSECKKITKIPKGFSNLYELNLSGCCNIDDRSLEVLTTFPNLHTLDISGCNITDQGLETIAHSLINLQVLDLENCHNITDLPIKEFGSLHKLNLSGCYNIDDRSLEDLASLPNLHTLDITRCAVTVKALKMLEKSSIQKIS